MADVRFSITSPGGLYRVAVDWPARAAAGRAPLVLTDPNNDDPDQQWTWVFMPALQASALFNPHRNAFAAPQSVSSGALVVAFGPDMPITAGATWIMASAPPTTIAPRANPDLILYALGGGSGYGGQAIGLGEIGQDWGDWTTDIIFT